MDPVVLALLLNLEILERQLYLGCRFYLLLRLYLERLVDLDDLAVQGYLDDLEHLQHLVVHDDLLYQ